MTYNVFGGTLSLPQSINPQVAWFGHSPLLGGPLHVYQRQQTGLVYNANCVTVLYPE